MTFRINTFSPDPDDPDLRKKIWKHAWTRSSGEATSERTRVQLWYDSGWQAIIKRHIVGKVEGIDSPADWIRHCVYTYTAFIILNLDPDGGIDKEHPLRLDTENQELQDYLNHQIQDWKALREQVEASKQFLGSFQPDSLEAEQHVAKWGQRLVNMDEEKANYVKDHLKGWF